MGIKVKIPNARLAYSPGLFTASKPATGQGDPKFGSPFIIEKDNPAVAELKKAIEAECVAVWKDKAAGVYAAAKAANKTPLRDGDGRLDKNGDMRPEFAGKLYIATNSKKAPTLYTSDVSLVTNAPGPFYSGCKCFLVVEIKAYDIPNVPGGRGVRAELLGVQFTGHGEKIGGGATTSADDYTAIPVEMEQSKGQQSQGGYTPNPFSD
jgi:hypothetical protein